MQIDELGLPYSGGYFRFEIQGIVKPIRIQLFIAGKLHFKGECPDPPCHEMTMIPIGSQGSVLQIVATDGSGAKLEKSFIIGASKKMPTGGGGKVPQRTGGMVSGAGG